MSLHPRASRPGSPTSAPHPFPLPRDPPSPPRGLVLVLLAIPAIVARVQRSEHRPSFLYHRNARHRLSRHVVGGSAPDQRWVADSQSDVATLSERLVWVVVNLDEVYRFRVGTFKFLYSEQCKERAWRWEKGPNSVTTIKSWGADMSAASTNLFTCYSFIGRKHVITPCICCGPCETAHNVSRQALEIYESMPPNVGNMMLLDGHNVVQRGLGPHQWDSGPHQHAITRKIFVERGAYGHCSLAGS
eukprot:2892794-Rhodomonas_salina.3